MTPSDEELMSALPGAVSIGRRPYLFASSYPLTELTVGYRNGACRMLLKELRPWRQLLGSANEPRREIDTYRAVLAPARIGPTLYAWGDDWMVVELVDGLELWQVGEPARWEAVASWLGRHHLRFAGREAQLRGASPGLLDGHDLVSTWVERAAPHVRGVLDIDACRRALAGLDSLPRTLVHGEFYPSNIMLAGDRVVPVDWETAALGPGVLDLAALITGWNEAVAQRLIAAYGGVEAGHLDQARLALALRWLGWAPEWTPPVEHRHDWLTEAVTAAERLLL